MQKITREQSPLHQARSAPNSLVGAAETAAPPDKKSLASEELARLLKWRFKMDLNQRPPD